jgi:hypothetical protein
MIDFRDPTVVDEESARIGAVLTGGATLHFVHTCHAHWVVEIESGPETVAVSDERVRLVGGDRRSPFACTQGPYEHDVLVGVLGDPSHSDREALSARIEAAVGPWATFAPETFDVDAVQRVLDEGPADERTTAWTRAPLTSLERRLPQPARAGFRAHLTRAGLGLPAFVTEAEAAHMTRGFSWLIGRASGGGIPLVDGTIDSAVVDECRAALDCDEDHVRRLIAAARQLRFVYSRNRHLVAKKSAIATARSATELWGTLAGAVSAFQSRNTVSTARDLLLLVIADGSLADPVVGLSHAAEAFALVGGGWPAWAHSWSGEPDRDPDCDQPCDCPSLNGTTWHDVVARAIRDAASAAATDGAVTVAARGDLRDAIDAGFARDWVESEPSHIRTVDRRARYSEREAADDTASEFLSGAAEVIDLLGLLGLARADDGAWIVPPTLREFARAALRERVETTPW